MFRTKNSSVPVADGVARLDGRRLDSGFVARMCRVSRMLVTSLR